MKTGVTINGQPIEIPVTWEEVKFGQFLSMKDSDTDAEMLAALSGLNVETCKLIEPDIIAAIILPSTELGEPEIVNDPIIFGKPVPKAIGKLEYARKVNCDNLSRRYNDEEMVGRMVAIYCADGIEDKDIEDSYSRLLNEPFQMVISAGKLISDQLVQLQKSEEKIPSPIYESEELSAGIKDFSKYGIFGVVRGIALRHGCKLEDVYAWPYNSVLLELRISAEESAYQRRLNRIMNRKK